MLISEYQFGRMIVDQRTYTGDLIIHGEKLISDWWRKSDHRLDLDDLTGVSLEGIAALIVGTGYSGLMTVCPSVAEFCAGHNIDLQALRTSQAVEAFNGWKGERSRLVGAFHLTC